MGERSLIVKQDPSRPGPLRRLGRAVAEVVWTPDEEALERANVVRLMRRHGIDDYWELVRRSQDDPSGSGPR